MKFFIATTPPNLALRDQLVAAGHVSTSDDIGDDPDGTKEKASVLGADVVILNNNENPKHDVILGLALAKGITILRFDGPSSASFCSFWSDPNIIDDVTSNENVLAFFAMAEQAKAEQAKNEQAAKEIVSGIPGAPPATPKMALITPADLTAVKGLLPEGYFDGFLAKPEETVEESTSESVAPKQEEGNGDATDAGEDDVIDPNDGDGIDRIRDERLRQVLDKGYDEEHDRQYVDNELAWAAVCYAAPGEVMTEVELENTRVAWTDPWPWSAHIDRRENLGRIRRLTIAGALIAAEIDRLIPYARPETAPADSSEGSALVRSVERSDGSGSHGSEDPHRGPLPDAVVDMLVRRFEGKHFFQAPAVAEALGTEDPDLVLQVIDAMLDEGHWEAQVGYRDPKRANGIILARKDGDRLIDARGNDLEDDDKVLFFRAVR